MPRRAHPFAALAALLLALALAAPLAAQDDPPDGVPDGAERATVRSVVDGDTIRVTLADGTKDTVRLIGVDTPETRDPDEPVGCYGPEASERVADILPAGRLIWLERDETNRDRYDRLLRYVWVVKSNGDAFLLNEVIVRDGYGLALRFPPDEARLADIEAAQGRAAARGAGLWSACPDFVLSLTPVPTPAPEPTAVPVPTTPPVVVQPTAVPVASNCHPSYVGACLIPGIGDYDCAGGSGNGPNYTGYVQVVGYDEFGLDGDSDGYGCE